MNTESINRFARRNFRVLVGMMMLILAGQIAYAGTTWTYHAYSQPGTWTPSQVSDSRGGAYCFYDRSGDTCHTRSTLDPLYNYTDCGITTPGIHDGHKYYRAVGTTYCPPEPQVSPSAPGFETWVDSGENRLRKAPGGEGN